MTDNDMDPESNAEMIAQLQECFQPATPMPAGSLERLYRTACNDTGGSQAARHFLFWLAGRPDPTGYQGDGAKELRRLDKDHRLAALAVFNWWTGATESDQPLLDVLDRLEERFAEPSSDPDLEPR